jgi:hypothetical protein
MILCARAELIAEILLSIQERRPYTRGNETC